MDALARAGVRSEGSPVGLGRLGLEALPDPSHGAWAARPPLAAFDVGLRGEPSPADRSSGPLLGRERELGQLRAWASATRSGRSHTVLVAGEEGVGKSCLVEAFVAGERAAGPVLCGRARSGGPAYGPWIDVLREALRAEEAAGRPATDALAQLFFDRCPPGPDDGGARLADGVGRWLGGLAERGPLVVVLEDLHLAAEPSLALFGHLAQGLNGAPVLLVGTLGVEAAPCSDGDPPAVLRLGGLDDAALRELVLRVTGHAPGPLALDLVRRASEGNPLVARAAARELAPWPHALLAAAGRDDATEARLAAGERALASLPASALALLRAGAVLGRTFDPELAASVAELAREEAREGAGLAAAAGWLHGRDGACSFTSAVRRFVVLRSLPPEPRRTLHREVARRLEQAQGERDALELSHHWLASGADGAEGGARWAAAAGERAAAEGRHELAAASYARALDALAALGPRAADPACRGKLLLAHSASLRRLGRLAEARAGLWEAAELGRALGEPALAAAAALALAATRGLDDADEPRLALLLERAAAAAELPASLRARALAALARTEARAGEHARARVLSRRALAEARAASDEGARAEALLACDAARPFAAPGGRARLARAIAEHARRAGAEALLLETRRRLVVCHLAAGEAEAAEAVLASYARACAAADAPEHVWRVGVLRAAALLLGGDLARAEREAVAALAFGRRVAPRAAERVFRLQSLALAREREGASEDGEARAHDADAGEERRDEPMAVTLASGCELDPGPARASRSGSSPVRPAPDLPERCLRAALDAARGDALRAGRELELLAARDFARVRRRADAHACLALLAEVAVALDDDRHAAALHGLLAPAAGRDLALEDAAVPLGPAERFLGLTASATGSFRAAAGHLEAALERAEAQGALVVLARLRLESAQALARRDDAGDRERAAELAEGARLSAERLGLAGLAARAAAFAGTLSCAREPALAEPAETGAPRGLFRREGEFWTVADQEHAVRLKDAKGLHYLEHLLRRPGREVHCLDLAAVCGGGPAAPAGDAGEHLDGPAREAYRRRVEELSAELEEARAFHDQGREETLRAELDHLARELARGVGLGGRSRRACSEAQRARLNVSRAIHAVLRRLQASEPILGSRLSETVRTGLYCCYTPDPSRPIDWQLGGGSARES